MNKLVNKGGALLAAVMMLAGSAVPAWAEDSSPFTAKGTVTASETVMILAPISGQSENFSLQAGDTLMAGQTAFTLRPSALTAPNDGVITSINALPGDQAQAVQTQYGALMYIERDDVWRVDVSSQGAYNAVENRDIRIGDSLRAQRIYGGEKINGTAEVIALSSNGYVVEMDRGEFELEDTIKFYIGTGKNYDSKDYAGSGKAKKVDAIAINAQGTVAAVLVEEGNRVTRGQSLMYMDSDGLVYSDNDTVPEVRADVNVIVAQVLVTPGQPVAKGQAVLAGYPLDVLEAQLLVDELDVANVKVGQTIDVAVDAYPDVTRTATIKEINPLGVTVLDTTKFIVTVTFEDSQGLMIGMQVRGIWE